MNFLGEATVRVSAVLALAFLLTWTLRRQPAALRHALWTVACTVALFTPLLMRVGPRVLRPPRAPAFLAARPAVAPVSAAAPGSTWGASAQPTPLLYDAVVGIVWDLGVLICVWRMFLGAARARSLRKTAAPLDTAAVAEAAGLSPALFQGAALAQSDTAAVAMTLGVRAPLILLPAHYSLWDRARLHAVLLHELEHVRRKDCLLQWLPQAVCAFHWFNPLVWLARSQMLCESERAADDAVLRAGVGGPEFARDLLDIAQSAGLKGADPMFITIASRLERRIARLVDPTANRGALTRARACAAVVLALILLAPLGAIRGQVVSGIGTLSGTVSDPAGAVVPGAAVNLYGPVGNLRLVSGPVGDWTAPNLPAGSYIVEVLVPGFAAHRLNVAVVTGEELKLKQALSIGQTAERLTITAQGTPRPAVAPQSPQRVRVGGNVQPARLLRRVDPEYPESLRQQGVEGTVMIQAVIGKSGNVLEARVQGQPAPELADAALAAVRTWQYQPTLLNGEPVELITTITVNFRLH